jgi:hypothetical protein
MSTNTNNNGIHSNGNGIHSNGKHATNATNGIHFESTGTELPTETITATIPEIKTMETANMGKIEYIERIREPRIDMSDFANSRRVRECRMRLELLNIDNDYPVLLIYRGKSNISTFIDVYVQLDGAGAESISYLLCGAIPVHNRIWFAVVNDSIRVETTDQEEAAEWIMGVLKSFLGNDFDETNYMWM